MLKSKWLWAAALIAGLVALYAFLGFRVAPGLIRSQTIDHVRVTYGRELQIGEVRVQPFKLQIEVRDLAFPDRDRQPMLSLKRLFVDFDLSSLWRRAYVFRELIVEAPAVRAVLRRDGTMNLADLSPPAGPDASPQQGGAGLPSVWIESLVISDGRAEYVDLAGRKKAFTSSFAPVGFSLKDFRTTPQGGAFRLSARGDAGEQFAWNGRFALSPSLESQGEFTIAGVKAATVAEFLGDALPFGLSAGTLELAGSYRVALGATTELKLQIPKLSLADLALRAHGAEADWIKIPVVAVADTAVALPEQAVTIGGVSVTGLRVTAWLNPDGSVNLTQMFGPGPAAQAIDTVTAGQSPAAVRDARQAPTRGEGQGKPWTLRLASLEVLGAAIDVEDRMKAPSKRFTFAPVNLRVRDASLDLSRPLPVSFDATINDHALFTAAGTLTPEPLAAELDLSLKQARMQILQPYLLPVADMTITEGSLAVDGKLRLAPPASDGPEISFGADVTIDDFKSVDNTMGNALVSFRRLQLRKLRYDMLPDVLSIDHVAVSEPYARLIISPEQVVNISAVLDPEAAAAATEARRAKAALEASGTKAEKRRREKAEKQRVKAAEKAAKKAGKPRGVTTPAMAPPPPESGMPIRIRQVGIERGRINFSDFSIQPNFTAEIVDLNGSVTDLSSAFSSRAKVDLKGKVDEYSPVTIAGTTQPFAFDRFTDIGLKFENIALPVFNPYSGQFAGYNIAKGKLTTDLRYQIDNRKLNASHKIRIDQLEWGVATASQGEATLPVKFATSLLKDRDGVIDLDVPVTGTLDDPKLRIGPIVWQVIKNLIVKAVTAPFALLGSLFADAKDAQFVDFAPGDASLDPATTERLAALSKSLVQKPFVALDVPIGAFVPIDAPAIAERRFLEQRTTEMVKVLRRREGDVQPLPAFDTLTAKQRLDVLNAMLKQQGGPLPEVPAPPAPPAPPDSMTRAEAQALAEAAQIEFLEKEARRRVLPQDDDLATLARERASAIQRALLSGGELEPSRVFLVTEGKVAGKDGKVRFELGLK
jgi:hypothetical protein